MADAWSRESSKAGVDSPIGRRHLLLRGIVQGVGMRPFVYGLARSLGLNGWVRNSSEGVHLEIEGPGEAMDRFMEDLRRKAPPRSRIEDLEWEALPPAGWASFEIQESLEETGKYQWISPDIATCPSCRREIFDPSDRRYRYPFTNCTQCGPRFTIIQDIPYDRPRTTMARFSMCRECLQEYQDPRDRRFHAQPNACPRCGPRLTLVDGSGRKISSQDPIASTIHLLRQGQIVALKGLGGFLLACDARDPAAVEKLRKRKGRPHKPFAVMLDDLAEVRNHCQVSLEEERLLLSPECPIVLLPWKETSDIAEAVAPGQRYLGVMLPYTPLHHLLLKESAMALVMTSGNRSEEPIARENAEALERLGGIADAFLIHDREIYVQYDDSVTAVFDHAPVILRRARGYAPFPIRLPFASRPILACGAEVKNTFCLTRDTYAFLSQHIGDLENFETLEHFERTIGIYRRLFRIDPEMIAYDLHPEYLATKYALTLPGKKIGIQHHFAHMVSCMAEHGEAGPVIGMAFDGLGLGADGKLWGGEFLVGDFRSFERMGHLEYVPQPGGAAAIQKPWRMAASYLLTFLGRETLEEWRKLVPRVSREPIAALAQQIEKGIHSPLTSSCGRLFDAVAALLGIIHQVSYEGQAAIALEMIADPEVPGSYDFDIETKEGRRIVLLRPLIEGLFQDLRDRQPPSAVAGKFHRTVAQIGVRVCEAIRRQGGPRRVALSGGVFQNRLLFRLMKEGLERAGFSVLFHRQVPCNDGGLALGQAVIANFAA
jgi:hydrogenase maturation protein HypF